MSKESPFNELTDAILELKQIETEGGTIEDFRKVMVELRTALIHFQGQLAASNMNQIANPMVASLCNAAQTARNLCDTFSLFRDQGMDSKTLATTYYALAKIGASRRSYMQSLG